MASTEVQGSLVNMRLREVGDTPFLTMVCTEDSTFEITNESSTRRTNCGIKKSLADADFTASGNAVHNATPTSSEVSYAQVKAWQLAKTKLQFRYISSADVAAGLTEGEGVHNFGEGKFTSSSLTASADADGVVSFAWTFEGEGTLDVFADGS